MVQKRKALISVSRKEGVVELAKELKELGFEIISTGGTYNLLKESGVEAVQVSDITGFPEILDGRVKTLHPFVHAGILANRSNPEHVAQLVLFGIEPIDLVVVNLYPFKETVLDENATMGDAIENIDVGGPTLIRAAAKNWESVTVLVDPQDYEQVIDELRDSGSTSLKTRFYLAAKAFRHTAFYDAVISSYFGKGTRVLFPEEIVLPFEKVQELRYGENPHQRGAFYKDPLSKKGLANYVQIQGKELSFNNLHDVNAVLETLQDFYGVSCAVAVKHANPCGVGVGENLLQAYQKAYEGDPVSIYGGIVGVNDTLDEATALEMSKQFLEVIVAPDFTPEALSVLEKKKNLRLLKVNLSTCSGFDIKRVEGGVLLQEKDLEDFDETELTVVTHRAPTPEEMADMRFAWKVVKHLSSNAIALAKNGGTVGMGAGQVNRVGAVEIAIKQAGDKARGSVLASDGFFPFSDSVELAAKAGITAIIQPGGSKRDQECIDAANSYNIAMVFTHFRHFRH